MLDCVIIRDFIDDLSSNNKIDLFYISFGGSTVPLSQFTSRDYMRDLAKSGISSTPTVIDNGWEITVKFQYTELRKFTKVYLLYSVNNQYKLAYVFNAADLQVFANYIKLDFSDFECNSQISTNHKNNNIIYCHRHTEASGGNDDINRTPPQQDLMTAITGLPQITSPGMSFLTVDNFGLTDKESKVSIDESFVDSKLKPTKKTLGVNFISPYLIEYDTKQDTGYNIQDLDLITVSGSNFDCGISITDFKGETDDEANKIGTLKFFPTLEHLRSFNGRYLVCDGGPVDVNLYPEYIRLFGAIFNNCTPDLSNGYIRSSGYMNEITKDGYPMFSQNPAQVKSHSHTYTTSYVNRGIVGMTPGPFGGYFKPTGNVASFGTIDASDVMVAKSFIGVWGIKAR